MINSAMMSSPRMWCLEQVPKIYNHFLPKRDVFFGMNIIMFNLWFGSIHILMGSPPVPKKIFKKINKKINYHTPSPSHHSPLRTHPKSRHCIGKTFNSCNRQLVRLPCFYQHHLGVEPVWWTKHPQTTGGIQQQKPHEPWKKPRGPLLSMSNPGCWMEADPLFHDLWFRILKHITG